MRGEVAAKLAKLGTDEQRLLRPLVETSRGFYLVAGGLGVIALWGLFAYYLQVRYGLGRTGLNRPEYWGIYIIDFVFFIGISHAGTLISAILRISQAEWRRAITRSAEFITVLVLGYGAIQPIIDLGRPDRVLNVLFHAQWRSPLLWDVMSIGLYLTASTVYLYIPMIPDLAIIRDAGIKAPRFYRFLAAGYQDTPAQRARLERAIGILRRVYRLQDYFKPVHFDYMGRLLLLFSLLWFYFTFAEYLTAFYGAEPAEMRTFWAKLAGPFAVPFWLMVLGCFIIPLALMSR